MSHRRITARNIAIGVLAAAFAGSAFSQATSRSATRIDLAAAYLAFEEAYEEANLGSSERRLIHREFDRAASHFFSGRLAEAVQSMNELSGSLRLRGEVGGEERLEEEAVRSLRVDFSPRVLVQQDDEQQSPRMRIRSLYSVPLFDREPLNITVRLVDEQGAIVWQREVSMPFRRAATQRILVLNDLPHELDEGTYLATITAAESDFAHTAGQFFCAHEPIPDKRAALLARLDRLAFDNDEQHLQRAINICRSRIGVLTDQPSPLNSIEFLIDPVAHAQQLAEEVTALESGSNPYRNRTGEHWRTVPRDGGRSPVMVYAPEAVAHGQPLPLLIALPGAGGDEAIFMRAYGAGKVRDLAEQRGFIVVSPLTPHVMSNPPLLDRIIDEMAADYPVDRSRIYALGHSLGGGTATAMVAMKPDVFAAVCGIAGASPMSALPDDQSHPPVLIIAAALDTIIPPQRLREIADAATARGLPIEFRLKDHMGHILVVNDVLEEAVNWLLQQAHPTE